MCKPSANTAFLKGFRYMFSFSLIVLSVLFFFMVGISKSSELRISNVLLGFSGIMLLALVVSFLTAYSGIKKGIEAGQTSDSEIFRKNGRLNLNFFKKLD